jgi:ProP effector
LKEKSHAAPVPSPYQSEPLGLVSPGILGCNTGIPLALLTASASMTNSSLSPARSLLQDLQARFAVFRDAQPLAIGIDAAILLKLPEMDRQVLRRALRQHTASTRYLKALRSANHRFDLDGNVAGEVSETQRNHAAETLKARFQKSAQLQKEEAEAAAAAARQQEKLTQLAAKFSR